MLHATPDNASAVGFWAGLGFFFSLDGMTFFLCGGLLLLCSNKGGRWHLTKVIVRSLLLAWCLEIRVERSRAEIKPLMTGTASFILFPKVFFQDLHFFLKIL